MVINAAAAAVLIATLVTGSSVAMAAPAGTTQDRGGDSQRHLTIRLHANEIRHNTYLDLGKKGPSPGDMIIENETLIRHGRHVGRDAVHGTLINPTHTRHFLVQAAVTWVLPRGQVTAQGAFNFSDIKVAITGGTGRFEGASGVAIVRGTKNPLNDIDVLRLVLPR
jgi:hypothetical protein